MDIDRLLDHSDWVRNLARSLVNDPDEADDLVQDTWAAALESPQREVASSRSWLARVLRNFAYSSFRRRQRRRSRERVAAAAEAIPSPEASIEKLEITRLLIDLVFALEEPGRTAVVLRYFEGLTSKEIARRLDASPGAVRMRLKRALGSLRAQLEERSGERGVGWKILLLPLLGGVSAPVVASGAETVTASGAEVAATGSTFSGAAVHAVAMAALAVSCFAGGWSLGGSAASEVAGIPEPASTEAPVVSRVDERSLENRIEELEACLETSRRRVEEKTGEILELKIRLATHVTAGATVFDPA